MTAGPDDGAGPTGFVAADMRSLSMMVQPIVDLAGGAIVAVEALASFGPSAPSSISEVFAAARAAGAGFELEATCIRAARGLRPGIDARVPIAINVSPDALQDSGVAAALAGDLTGFIVELTEHPANAPGVLEDQVADLRHRGAMIAIDDVTTGYAGLLRLAELRPDIVKLDQRLIAGVRGSAEQVAVIEALVMVARALGAQVAAEGVENLADLGVLSALGVDYVQGWAVLEVEEGDPAGGRRALPVGDDAADQSPGCGRRAARRPPAVTTPSASSRSRTSAVG